MQGTHTSSHTAGRDNSKHTRRRGCDLMLLQLASCKVMSMTMAGMGFMVA